MQKTQRRAATPSQGNAAQAILHPSPDDVKSLLQRQCDATGTSHKMPRYVIIISVTTNRQSKSTNIYNLVTLQLYIKDQLLVLKTTRGVKCLHLFYEPIIEANM